MAKGSLLGRADSTLAAMSYKEAMADVTPDLKDVYSAEALNQTLFQTGVEGYFDKLYADSNALADELEKATKKAMTGLGTDYESMELFDSYLTSMKERMKALPKTKKGDFERAKIRAEMAQLLKSSTGLDDAITEVGTMIKAKQFNKYTTDYPVLLAIANGTAKKEIENGNLFYSIPNPKGGKDLKIDHQGVRDALGQSDLKFESSFNKIPAGQNAKGKQAGTIFDRQGSINAYEESFPSEAAFAANIHKKQGSLPYSFVQALSGKDPKLANSIYEALTSMGGTTITKYDVTSPNGGGPDGKITAADFANQQNGVALIESLTDPRSDNFDYQTAKQVAAKFYADNIAKKEFDDGVKMRATGVKFDTLESFLDSEKKLPTAYESWAPPSTFHGVAQQVQDRVDGTVKDDWLYSVLSPNRFKLKDGQWYMARPSDNKEDKEERGGFTKKQKVTLGYVKGDLSLTDYDHILFPKSEQDKSAVLNKEGDIQGINKPKPQQRPITLSEEEKVNFLASEPNLNIQGQKPLSEPTAPPTNLETKVTKKMVDNNYTGQGTRAYDDGAYVGEYKNGKESGQGTFTYNEGDKYEGEFKDGKMHGQGTYASARGNKYVGEWKDNKMHGKGVWTFDDEESDPSWYWEGEDLNPYYELEDGGEKEFLKRQKAAKKSKTPAFDASKDPLKKEMLKNKKKGTPTQMGGKIPDIAEAFPKQPKKKGDSKKTFLDYPVPEIKNTPKEVVEEVVVKNPVLKQNIENPDGNITFIDYIVKNGYMNVNEAEVDSPLVKSMEGVYEELLGTATDSLAITKPLTHDDKAWCGAFVYEVLTGTGAMKGGDRVQSEEAYNKLRAREYLKVGDEIKGEPKIGDIIVVSRMVGDKKQHHVAFYSGKDKNGNVIMLGGNQDDQVSFKTVDKSYTIEGYRRIKNMTDVKEGTVAEYMVKYGVTGGEGKLI